ncbi:MAG: thioredoxin domain-containing protein [Actinomycetota bacterium]
MTNRLASSTSPYLLQHAENPVDWFEWGEEAFAEAARRDVPVLLSVGYSSCHWCHVMAHESFEDELTAEEMNRRFVNIKVDREERPDVDEIYMEAVQAMTGRGGWPMTVWLTPEGRPFYAGTYFPNVDRPGLPSFGRVMAGVTEAWNERRQSVTDQAHRITTSLGAELASAPAIPDRRAMIRAYGVMASTFDDLHGGFGPAPKFPQQPVLEFLLRLHGDQGAPRTDEMLGRTLTAMAGGGIHDQLAGGFSRYSVDDHWLVPHFEKMLYDNAQLAHLYLWAGIELGRADLIDTCRTTIDYLLNDLRHFDGGFYSAEDADSEGVEGRFYVWRHNEFMAVTGEDGPLAAAFWGVTKEGNFEGSNILHRAAPLAEVTARLEVDPIEAASAVERARLRLLEVRSHRIRPGLDDKVVAGWNGLAIRALAEAGAALHEPRYLEAAGEAARFVLERMASPHGGLVRAWAKGRRGQVPGFLEDHAAVGLGLLTLYSATGEPRWFGAAEPLIRMIPTRFGSADGALYSSQSNDLIKRPRDLFDNPSPSGNSLAAEAMLLLSLYTGDLDLKQLAEAALKSAGMLIERYPTGAGYALSLLVSLHRGTKEVAIVGPDLSSLSSVFWSRYRPQVALATSPIGDDRIPLLAGRGRPDHNLAYVCEGLACLAPTESPEALAASLERI